MSTIWCGLSANLECRSETCCVRLAENTGRQKSPKSRHLGTIPQFCRAISSQLRHVSTIGKKLVKQQYLHHMSPQHRELGLLASEIVSFLWGTPADFNGFRVLAALLHNTLVVGVSQTLQHWTEGATYIRQGGHHVEHWPTFLVVYVLIMLLTINRLFGFCTIWQRQRTANWPYSFKPRVCIKPSRYFCYDIIFSVCVKCPCWGKLVWTLKASLPYILAAMNDST